MAKAKGALFKGVGALLLLFIAYHAAVGVLRTVVFWAVTPVLGVAAFYIWRLVPHPPLLTISLHGTALPENFPRPSLRNMPRDPGG